MVAGDLNARIGDWNLMTDVDDGKLGACVDGNDKRRSQDNCTNQFWKILTDVCRTFQCTLLNGNHSNDIDGRFTFVSNQVNSMIDYVVVSADIIDKT